MSGDQDPRRENDPRWGDLPTESRHPESHDLDTLAPEGVVQLLVEEDRRGIETLLSHTTELALAATWLAETLEAGGRILLAGAGTSGRLAVLEAAECPPTFGTAPEQIQAVIAGGPEAVFAAHEGAEDREEDGRAAAEGLREGDLLVGVSASSLTPFVRGALAAARGRGARTVLLTCAAASRELTELVDLLIALDTGAEILTGSTRLKAGSATKAALNAVTTAAMVQAGKVYENLMVDLRPGSAKLRDRAVRITAAAAEVTPEKAADLLCASDGEVKIAIVMARLGVPIQEARQRLQVAGGSVRRALASYNGRAVPPAVEPSQPRIHLPEEAIREFCRRHRIRRLALFGSVLRENFGPDSDVDVLIEFEPGTRIGLRFFTLQEELGRILGRKVDLNTAGFLSRYFRDRVLAEAETIYDAA